MARAQSNYKQARVTLTEERDLQHPGRVHIGIRVLIKGQNQDWTERHLVYRNRLGNQRPLRDVDDVYAALLELLAVQPLPGHIG